MNKLMTILLPLLIIGSSSIEGATPRVGLFIGPEKNEVGVGINVGNANARERRQLERSKVYTGREPVYKHPRGVERSPTHQKLKPVIGKKINGKDYTIEPGGDVNVWNETRGIYLPF